MTYYDVWILVKPADWNAASAAVKDTYLYKTAIKGYWKSLGTGETVYNICGTLDEVNALVAEFPQNAGTYAWIQGTGEYVTTPAQYAVDTPTVVSVMPNFQGQPATYEDPHWGAMFAGQQERQLPPP